MNINPFEILKNAQKIQERLGAIKVTGFAGGGMVEVDLNGRMEMVAIRLAPEAVDPADTEMLQDLIIAAFTNGMEKVRESLSREMGGMGIPGIIPGFPGGA